MAEPLYWILGRGTFVSDDLAPDGSTDCEGMSAFQILNAHETSELTSCESCGKSVGRVTEASFRLTELRRSTRENADFLSLSGAHGVSALAVSQPALTVIRSYCPDVRVRSLVDAQDARVDNWLQIGGPGAPAHWLPPPTAPGRACAECGRDIVDAKKTPKQWIDARTTADNALIAVGGDPWQRLYARAELADALQAAGLVGLTLLETAELH
jgi:hypothetical protein